MVMSSGPVRLFYDAGCGPCTFFAHAFRGVSRTPINVQPLDGKEADTALREMSSSERFGAFHFLVGERTFTGVDAMPPLMETTFGSVAGRVSRNAPPVAWFLRRSYRWFWEYRRTRGCVAERPV